MTTATPPAPWAGFPSPSVLSGAPAARSKVRSTSGGFTLIETLMAAVVTITALGAIFLVSSRCMGMIPQSQNVAVATAMLHERMSQLQNVDWETLTDSDFYLDQVWTDPEDGTTENVDGLLKYATTSGDQLRKLGVVETVRISAYRPIAMATAVPAPITATRSGSTVSVTSSATNLGDEKAVRIDLRVTWTDGRLRLPRSLGLSRVVAMK